jgi:hypothetical protein
MTKWYQKLEQNFFVLCKKRGIKGEARTLLIYLRGLYCAFGKPDFYCKDKIITEDLQISRMHLYRIRKKLMERGVIEFKTSSGNGKSTEYLILKTELAPELKRNKMLQPCNKMLPLNVTKCYTPINKSNNREELKEAVLIKDTLMNTFLNYQKGVKS